MTDSTPISTLQEQIQIFHKQLYTQIPADLLGTWQNEVEKIVQ